MFAFVGYIVQSNVVFPWPQTLAGSEYYEVFNDADTSPPTLDAHDASVFLQPRIPRQT